MSDTNLHCCQIVVVRWEQKDTTGSVAISASSTLKFLEKAGYKFQDADKIRCMPCSKDPEQFLILRMGSEEEIKKICDDSEKKGFAINRTRINVHRLVGPDGVRIRDVADCMKIWYEHIDNNETIDLVLGLVVMELPVRVETATTSYRMILAGMGELIENGKCTVFGSFASSERRHGCSDIDINVESVPTPESPGTETIRPHMQIMDNPKILTRQKLTQAEFYAYPHLDIIKALYRCVTASATFRRMFEISFIPARTPILSLKMKHAEMHVTFDISVNNQAGVDKAHLLDLFISQDKSIGRKMKRAVAYLQFWAKSNKLMNGAYPEEKTDFKTGFNSYIFNQLIIHFVQAFAQKDIVFPKAAKPENRVIEYNFDDMFADYSVFLKEFFKYVASFDFVNSAIYGRQVLQKVTVEKVHKSPKTPLMIMDPMDYTHNVSAKVTDEAIKLLNGLIRNALFILKQKGFYLTLLLRTHDSAMMLMRNKESHTCNTTNQVPAALSEFASVSSGHQEYLTFQLPSIIQTSEEFMLLLTRILRFDVSPRHEGPSVNNLYNTMGVIFVILAKSWIGRRNKKRLLKNHMRREASAIELDVMCSDSYKDEDEPIAELRIAMSDIPETTRKIVYVEMKQGQVSDVRDAMHFLIDQFMMNNLSDLCQMGIMGIDSIPVFTSNSTTS